MCDTASDVRSRLPAYWLEEGSDDAVEQVVQGFWLRAACRRNSNSPATHVLTSLQLNILVKLGSRKLPPRPTVHDALWAIAALGGHMKTNGEPGWLVLHRGMTKLLAYEQGWRARENSLDL